MAHRYFPHTPEDVEQMLDACGMTSTDQLYADIPESLKFNREYSLPSEMTEAEVRDFFKTTLRKNKAFKTNLIGAGYYSHEVPSIIPSIVSRSEFLTAYTPYQPEISQGTLQYIFEYQTLMSRLTGMEISNASLYDGATATAEATMLAVAHVRKRNRVLISEGLNPAIKRVVETYAKFHGITLSDIPLNENGSTSKEELQKLLCKGDVAGVIVSSPNYYGILEDFTDWSEICHSNKALFIMSNIAADLVSIKSPGEWGADIAVGDAQSLGIPLGFGGPYLGYICAKKSLMRKLPGRIVGMTKDSEGRRSFVLTLQAREQHIRREKATSNICSNQGLMALYVTIYMSLLGYKGLKEINTIGVDGAHWFAGEIIKTGKARLSYPNGMFFNEFCITFKSEDLLDKFVKVSKESGIIPGLKVGKEQLLIAITETSDRESLLKLIGILQKI